MSKPNLSLTNDHIFHRVFGVEETKDSLIYIINEVFADLNLQKIKEITILNPITYSEFIKGKNSVLDIKAKSETDELFNIEMHYAGMDAGGGLSQGAQRALNTMFSVNLLMKKTLSNAVINI